MPFSSRDCSALSRVTAAIHRMMTSRCQARFYRKYLQCVGTYRSLHSVLTDEDNDVRGVKTNASALRATAAASSASDDSSRQKKPRKNEGS